MPGGTSRWSAISLSFAKRPPSFAMRRRMNPISQKALRHIADQIQAEADDLSKATGVNGVGFV